MIAFLSHDDRWAPGKIARQIAHLSPRPETTIVHTWFQFVLQPGSTVPRGFRHHLFEQVQTGRLMETMLARSKVFDEVGPFATSYPVAPDMDWFARAQDRGVRSDFIPAVLLYKRVHAGNTSNNIAVNNANLLSLLRQSVTRKRAKENGA